MTSFLTDAGTILDILAAAHGLAIRENMRKEEQNSTSGYVNTSTTNLAR
jgi:hypothetical protein